MSQYTAMFAIHVSGNTLQHVTKQQLLGATLTGTMPCRKKVQDKYVVIFFQTTASNSQ